VTRKLLWLPGLVIACAMVTPMLHADEGMWLFTNPPSKQLKEKYKFEVNDKWLEHVQKASVRFNNGGSGSFVSPDGLILTNHHVGADSLEKLGGDKHDYLKEGFYAKTRDEEMKCVDLELNVLMKIEDVTDKVKAAVTPDLSPEKAAAARRDAMARIEKDATDKTKLRCDVVTLYQGGEYHLYQYKKYTDVRVVFAPEQQIAFFGGDPDNFEYPRFDLDICIFRVYEDGKPAKIEHYLKWSKDGAKDNELVFVSGHPGRTRRLTTVAELEYLRDTEYPYVLQRLNRAEVLLLSFSGRSAKNAQEAKETLFGVQNSRKARIGGLGGLLDPQLMAAKKAQEDKLKSAAEKDSSFKKNGSPWDKIAAAMKVRTKNLHRFTVLEGRAGFNSDLYGIGRTLLRAGDERPKPNGERLREFGESRQESLKFQLFSEAPIYEDFEIVKLTDSLTFLAGELGADDPLVKKVLNGKSPADRAAELVMGTKLKDVAVRKKLWEGGKDAVAAAKDPMIELARLVDADARAVRKVMENEVDEVLQQAYADIAKLKFKEEGTSTYPDATFTLRLSYGVVKGFEENGKKVPFETKLGGIFERAKANNYKEPFDLPERWLKVEKDSNAKLKLDTPFNFVCTADIIGGNSGSPVINKDAEVVGLIFDGNIQSLVLDFAFTETQARAVSVHSQGIIEALRHVYNANNLADELTGKSGKSFE
jgi:hypothetical protein